jgi:hypothetical protein
MNARQRRAQVLGDRVEGKDKNYGSVEGVPLNPNFRSRSAAGSTSQEIGANTASPDAQRALKAFYTHPSSQPRYRR